MEGELETPTQICGDEEFYEKIEAPKFVDFTAPDRCRPDDRFWFCLRVGCDRKHEEEIDHEAISKDFVLRVMAARSPNVRLRKILNRNTSGIKGKCPLSAPAKPTKPRLSKLAVISSISRKIVDTKPKTKPISKPTSTPKLPKGKQVAAKYLTTPSHKLCPPSTNKSFRSVKNRKPTDIAVPKNKIVAKSLFRSPKKGICVKTSAELRTPLTKICEGIKKLDIASQRKRVLGYSCKLSKEIKQKSVCKDKSKISSLSRPLSTKEQKSKSLRGFKGKSDNELDKVFESTHKGAVENESSDLEIDMKSRISDRNNSNTGLADVEERSTVEFEEGNEVSAGNLEVKTEALLEMRANLEDRVTKSENLENDGKENASAPDYNMSCGRNLPEKSGTKINKKVVKTQDINLKEGHKAAATGAQAKKYKKPKPTNPKPFRLRTDERGILREANVERRAPLQETEAVFLTLPNVVLDKKDNEIEKQTRPAERSDGDRKLRQKAPNTTTSRRRPNPTKHRENERNILGEISEKSTRKTKSPSLQPHFMMPIGGASTRKTNAFDVKIGDKLAAIKETSSTEAGERSHSSRSVSQGKKSTTIVKEPNFQSLRAQKSCEMKVA